MKGSYDAHVLSHSQLGGHVVRSHTFTKNTPLHTAARGGHLEVVRYVYVHCTQYMYACIDSIYYSPHSALSHLLASISIQPSLYNHFFLLLK